MKTILNTIVFFTISFIPSLAYAGGVNFLAQHQWEKRIVLIFGADLQADALKSRQNYYAQYADGIEERDMLVMYIPMAETNERMALIDKLPQEHSLMTEPTETHFDLMAMYNAERIDGRTVLIGKDGGTKGEWDTPPDIREIFAMIDKMPMRIREMHENNDQK